MVHVRVIVVLALCSIAVCYGRKRHHLQQRAKFYQQHHYANISMFETQQQDQGRESSAFVGEETSTSNILPTVIEGEFQKRTPPKNGGTLPPVDPIKKSADDIKAEIEKLNVLKFEGVTMAKVKGGLDTALAGADGFYDSYKKKDNIGMAINVITIFSGVSALVGGPIGLVVAAALNALATALKIIKKERAGPEESESEKLEKVIKKALNEFRGTQLKAEWSGYERLADLYLKHLEFVQFFDESKPSSSGKNAKEKLDPDGVPPGLKSAMFEVVTPQIYKVLMSSSHLLGKIEYEISQICDFDVQMKKVNSQWRPKSGLMTEKNQEPKPEDLDEQEKIAKSCLGIYELYAKISFFHQATYTTSLGSLSEIITSQAADKAGGKGNANKAGSEKECNEEAAEKTKTKAYVYTELLLDMIGKSNDHNKKLFLPLVSPFNNYKMRFTVNYYQTYSNNYKFLSGYLNTLYYGKTSYVDNERVLKDVMLCSQQTLLGSCYLEESEKVKFDGVSKEARWRSIYVPKGKTVKVFYKNEAAIAPMMVIGPGTIGSLYKVPKDKAGKMIMDIPYPVTNMVIRDTVLQTGESIFKMCVAQLSSEKKKQPDSYDYHNSMCTTKTFIGSSATFELKDIKGDIPWKGNYISISSDEPDLAFVGTGKIKTTDKSGIKLRWGPFFSPRKLSEACGSALWDTITVYRYKNEAESTIKEQIDEELCKGEKDKDEQSIKNLLCYNDVIDKSLFVTICKQPELKGYCEEIPLVKGFRLKKVRLSRINGYVEFNKKDITNELLGDEKIKGIDERFNEKIDNCIWFPRQSNDIKSTLKLAVVYKDLLASMKIPEGVRVKLYTNGDGTGTMFGPYVGPVTIDRIDGNDSPSNVIQSMIITSFLKETRVK